MSTRMNVCVFMFVFILQGLNLSPSVWKPRWDISIFMLVFLLLSWRESERGREGEREMRKEGRKEGVG